MEDMEGAAEDGELGGLAVSWCRTYSPLRAKGRDRCSR